MKHYHCLTFLFRFHSLYLHVKNVATALWAMGCSVHFHTWLSTATGVAQTSPKHHQGNHRQHAASVHCLFWQQTVVPRAIKLGELFVKMDPSPYVCFRFVQSHVTDDKCDFSVIHIITQHVNNYVFNKIYALIFHIFVLYSF